MDLQDWGAVGEFVGALLFFVSLIYLSLQIRHSARTASFSTLQEIQRDWREINAPADPRITEAVAKELAGETPNPSERFYLRSYFLRHMRIYETLWFAHDNGLLDTELFERYIANMPDIVMLGRNPDRWELYKGSVFHAGFVAYADGFLSSHRTRMADIYADAPEAAPATASAAAPASARAPEAD